MCGQAKAELLTERGGRRDMSRRGSGDLLLTPVKQVRGIGGNGREWPGWDVGRERPNTVQRAGLDQFRTNSCKLHGMP